jgi:uncharacterized protein YfaS (alpha-2-macroglobulin family)
MTDAEAADPTPPATPPTTPPPAPHPKRRRDPRNLAIVLLSLLVVVLLGALFGGRIPGLLARMGAAAAGEPVAVIDVVLDRRELRSLDVLFDRPLGADQVGDTLGRNPAEVTPALAGVWRWLSPNLLRFEPFGGFAIATEYRVQLLPERILKPGQRFKGKTKFDLKTDQFLVEKVDVREEPAPGGGGGVVLMGEARFNYEVDPRFLATKMRLFDPLRGDEDPVSIVLDQSYWTAVVGFRTEALTKQKTERELRLVILGDLTPARGNVPLGSDFVKKVAVGSNVTLAVRGVSAIPGAPDSSVRVVFSSAVDPEVAGPYVKVAPETAYELTASLNELILAGAFRPGEEYTISIAAGLPAKDESSLPAPFERRFRMADLEPQFGFQSAGMFLSAGGHRTVAVESVNVERLELTIDRVFLNNLFFFFSYEGYDAWDDDFYPHGRLSRALGDRIVEETLRPGGGRNVKVVTPLDLERRVRGQAPGLYRVGLNVPGAYEGKERWLLITDLGIVARQGEGEFLVWVSSFKDLSPAAGASVRLLSDQNQTMAEGRTDASGLWRARDLGDPDEKARPHMVVVERGADFSFLLLPRSGIDTAGFDVGGSRRPQGGYEAFVYGERDIYRPGETVEGLAVVRDRSLAPPPAMPLLLRHRDPEGRDRGSVRLAMDRRGSAPFSLPVESYAPTGRHLLEVVAGETVIGEYRFQVEEFIPDRIKVEIARAGGAVAAGAPIAYEVRGAYLFGPPAAGLAVESRVRLEPVPFEPEGYDGFTFGYLERKFEPREIAAEAGETLDAEGRRSYEVVVPSGLTPPSSLEAVLTARVQEQGGRGVSALDRVKVHPWKTYLGLRLDGDAQADRGRPVGFTWAAVSSEGAGTASGPLRAELFHDRWHSNLRWTAAGNWRWESVREPRLVETASIPGGAARGTFTFTPREFGSYRAVLTDPATGAAAQVAFYAGGWGYSPWAIKDPGRIELEPDREEHAPGEVAKVLVRAPFPGRLLLTVEREGIHETQIHTLAGNTARIEVPIRAEYRPNAYVTATLVRAAADLEPGAAGRAFGAVPLIVDREPNRLAVAVAAPEEIRPGTRLSVSVASAPGAAVTVAAVDEGILQLVAQKTPDPFGHFYRKLALGVRGYDIFALLMPEVRPAGARAAPGGDEGTRGRAQFVGTSGIRRVEPVAFWSGVVETDGSGRAEVGFDVPEFQGALRVMAVAHRDHRFGSAAGTTRVRSPLVILPTFPRFLSFSETARIPVTVRNDTGRDGAFRLRLAAEGPVRIEGDAFLEAPVPHGSERTVHFTICTGEQIGGAKLTVTGSGNGESASASADLPVRADLPARTVERTGAFTEAATSLAAEEAEGLRTGTLRRELRIGRTPFLQLYGKLRDVLHYPYGCVEQTTSAAFPLLYVADLAREMEPDLFEKADPAVLVQEGIRRLGGMQVQNGGFAMWPGGTTSYPWGSLYATHFLVEARRAGYAVEAYVHDRALEYVAGEATAKTAYSWDELQRTAYALYVLARAGRPDRGTMDFIRERNPAELRPESRALLGAAYAAAGDPRALLEMTAAVGDTESAPRQTGGNLDSPIRNRALLLLAFLDAAPRDLRVVEIARRLGRDVETTRWWTTQESAFALVALGQLFRQQAAKAPYAGTVRVGDRTLGRFTARTAVFRDIEGTAPIQVAMDAGYESGAAFYSLLTRGVPEDAAFRPSAEGFEITRAFFDRNGAPLDLGALAQGDLVVMKTQVRSPAGRVENVALVSLLPSGLEVENPRIRSSETLPWIGDASLPLDFLDYRDDRVLLFLDLPPGDWRTSWALLRAVTPGTFRLPPPQAEAMYEPRLRAAGERGTVDIKVRR